jgi:hypothetical protein
VLVNGRTAYYSVSIAGAAPTSDDVRVQQAESAAVFEAMSKLKGSDLMFVTRSIVQSDASDRICATVWGQGARLKKGPTVVATNGDAPSHAASAPSAPSVPIYSSSSAPTPAPYVPVAAPPAPPEPAPPAFK